MRIISRTPTTALSGIVLLAFCHHSLAAGHVYNENFSVLTPAEPSAEAAQLFAEQLLEKAETFRREIALQWLGMELPRGIGRTLINVSFSSSEDVGLTWAVDSARREEHTLYMSTSPERALGSTLKHELVHVVLATRFPGRLPAWVEEGIASRYDDAQRTERRVAIMNWLCETDHWPRLQTVFAKETILATDEMSYAVASSVTDFLLSQEDRSTLLRFAEAVTRQPLENALATHYQMTSVAELERAWQQWLKQSRLTARLQSTRLQTTRLHTARLPTVR